MRFLNPKTDFAFKRIFGSGESGDILLSFLNAILDLRSPYRICEVEILDPYLAPKIKGMKDTYLDVRAKDERGKSYIIEMQVLNVEGFEKRVLYNACKAYAGQLSQGESYQLLTDVIAITITDFIMFPELAGVVNNFKLRDESGEVYHDDLELVFAELPKFAKDETMLSSDLDRWFYFLTCAADLRAIPKVLNDDAAVRHAFNIANKAGLTEEELDDQERREIFIHDQRGALALARRQGQQEGRQEGRLEGRLEGRQEGRLEGRQEGRLEGRQEGMQEAKREIARTLLASYNDDEICAITGLLPEDVRSLRDDVGA